MTIEVNSGKINTNPRYNKNQRYINPKPVNQNTINPKPVNTQSVNIQEVNPQSVNIQEVNPQSVNIQEVNPKQVNTKSINKINTKSINKINTKLVNKINTKPVNTLNNNKKLSLPNSFSITTHNVIDINIGDDNDLKIVYSYLLINKYLILHMVENKLVINFYGEDREELCVTCQFNKCFAPNFNNICYNAGKLIENTILTKELLLLLFGIDDIQQLIFFGYVPSGTSIFSKEIQFILNIQWIEKISIDISGERLSVVANITHFKPFNYKIKLLEVIFKIVNYFILLIKQHSSALYTIIVAAINNPIVSHFINMINKIRLGIFNPNSFFSFHFDNEKDDVVMKFFIDALIVRMSSNQTTDECLNRYQEIIMRYSDNIQSIIMVFLNSKNKKEGEDKLNEFITNLLAELNSVSSKNTVQPIMSKNDIHTGLSINKIIGIFDIVITRLKQVASVGITAIEAAGVPLPISTNEIAEIINNISFKNLSYSILLAFILNLDNSLSVTGDTAKGVISIGKGSVGAVYSASSIVKGYTTSAYGRAFPSTECKGKKRSNNKYKCTSSQKA
jgi:hypothetical protein